MSRALGAPLAAAAAVAAFVALLSLERPVAAAAFGAITSGACAFLAYLSADEPRRRFWAAIAVVAAFIGLRALVAPPMPDVWPLLVRVAALREALTTSIVALIPEPEAAIVLGIALGERSGIPRDLRDAFASTGTAHLLAISGFNMTLVASGVALALRGRMTPVFVALATIAAVVAYSALVGPAASVARAACMAIAGALGLALGRGGVAANALGAAIVALLVGDPAALEDVGFLLSVAATAGLIAWQRPLAERFARLPGPVAEGLAATLAASAPTIPIVAAVFGRVSLVSPLANLVAVPLFPLVLLFGAATAAVGAISAPAAGALAAAAYASAFILRRAVELFAAVPLASAEVPSGPWTGVILAAALGAGALAARRIRIAPLRAIVARASAVTTIAAALVPARALLAVSCVVALAGGMAATALVDRSPSLRIRALDVGQGDAFLVETEGRYALIDGGPDPRRLLRELGRFMRPWERRIDLVVLTHEHADHGAGLIAVIDRYEVGVAVEPHGMNDVPLVREWSEALGRANVRRVALASGATMRFGHATIRVLSPGRDRALAVPSLVLRLESPEGSALFLGDATDDAIADLLLEPSALVADVFVPPHHGAETTHALPLAGAVRAKAALISVGAGNRYGHPAPSTLTALGDVPVYRTDRHGTVEIELDGHRTNVRTERVPPDRGGPVPRAAASR